MSLERFGFAADSGNADAPVEVDTPSPSAVVPAAAAVVEATQPSLNQGGRKKPAVDLSEYVVNAKLSAFAYKHGGWLRSRDGNSALCPECKEVVQTAGNTTNITNHMARKHEVLHKTQMDLKDVIDRSSGKPKNKLPFTPSATTFEKIKTAIAEFVVLDQQPMNVVENDAFKNLLRVAAKDLSLQVPSRPTISTRVQEIAKTAEHDLRCMLKGTRPALTTDIWTSGPGDPYMCVTAHFIVEGRPELVSTTLSCRLFRGSHTAERIAEHLEKVMADFGISDSVVALTTDTAANVKCAGTKKLAAEWQGCCCHLLQLCALKILNERHVKATFAKHNKLSGHLNHSTAASEKLTKLQKAADMSPRAIPTTTSTRWNSHYDQAVILMENKYVVSQLCASLATEGKLQVTYTENDWKITAAVIEVLALFAKTTKIMQGENFITNSMMAMMGSQLELLCVSKATSMDLPDCIRKAADEMFESVEDKFYPPSKCAMIAALADPRTKALTWCSKREKQMYRKHTVAAMIAATSEHVTTSGGGSADRQTEDNGAGGTEPSGAASGEEVATRKDHRRKEVVDEGTLLFAQLLKASAVLPDDDDTPAPAPLSREAVFAEKKRACEYELDRYLQGEGLPSMSSSQAVLNWWYEKRQIFPVLYKVSCIYLAVPASSGSSERVFSAAGNIVTNKRNRLGDESVSNLVFLHGCHGVAWNMGGAVPRAVKRARNASAAN